MIESGQSKDLAVFYLVIHDKVKRGKDSGFYKAGARRRAET